MNNELWQDGQLVYGSIILRLAFEESQKQIEKWGVQTRTPEEWMLYLTEEVGELAEAIAEHKYRDGTRDHVVEEAIQVTTLAMKIIEMNYNSSLHDDTVIDRLEGKTNLLRGEEDK